MRNCAIFKVCFFLIFLSLSCQSSTPFSLEGSRAEAGEIQGKRQKQEVSVKSRSNYLSEKAKEGFRLRSALLQVQCQNTAPQARIRLLEGESEERSYSIGNTSDGYLVNAQSLMAMNPSYRILPTQYERSLSYASNELLAILEESAAFIHKKFKNTVLYFGNFSAKEGGDIPYSVSHNSGRDADILFIFKKASDDVPDLPKNLITFSSSLRSKEPPGYIFDTEKNAALVEFLMMHPKIRVQFIFMAKYLRSAILQHYIKNGAKAEVIERFEQIVQAQAAHNDHMHIRVYCAKHEICAGCIDRSLIHPWHEDPVTIRTQCVEKYSKIINSKRQSAQNIAAAIERLTLLGEANNYKSSIIKHLKHETSDVRLTAATAAANMEGVTQELGKSLEAEGETSVRCALTMSLSKMRDSTAFDFMLRELDRPEISCKGTASTQIILQTLGLAERKEIVIPIFEAMKRSNELNRGYFNRALQTLTNQSLEAEEWEKWISQNMEKSRKQWLIQGFNAAGFKVKTLSNADIPLLLDAILGPPHISINAQRQLMRLSNHVCPSLEWSSSDALWYYTRYFKRRVKKYKIDLSDRNERGEKL